MDKKYVFNSVGQLLCCSVVDYFPISAYLFVFCSLHTVLADYIEKKKQQQYARKHVMANTVSGFVIRR